VQITDLGAGLGSFNDRFFGGAYEFYENGYHDLFTVSRIDLMALSSGSVGLPGRPLIYLLSPNSSTAYQ
jgi:hypothetical protein